MGYDRDIEVWPGNWQPVLLFNELSTQWRRADMAGSRVGLDYRVLFDRLDRLEPDNRTAWERLFSDIRAMEGAAIVAASSGDNDED